MKNIEKLNLVNTLLQKGLINKDSNLIEVNESCGNQVFSTEKLFIKVSPHADNLQTEYDSLVLLDSIHTPKAMFYEKIFDTSDIYYVLGISNISGKTLEHYWGKMNPSEKDNLVMDVIRQMKYIHRFDSGSGVQNICDIWEDSINQGKYKFHPNIDLESLRPWINRVHILMRKIENESKFLTHNDIWYKNILLENNKFSGIIDFEMSCLAPIRFEYYGLLLTNYYVFMTECGDSGKFEQEFCKLLSTSIDNTYGELLKHSNKEEFICFCFMAYLKKLGQYEEEWYNHNETLCFMDDIERYSNSVFD